MYRKYAKHRTHKEAFEIHFQIHVIEMLQALTRNS